MKKYRLKNMSIYNNSRIKNIDENFINNILKLLNINIEQKGKNLLNDEQYIKEELRENGYAIEYINIQNNSINGSTFYNIKKLFFKILPKNRAINEIIGYLK